jgi:hypothetical protein
MEATVDLVLRDWPDLGKQFLVAFLVGGIGYLISGLLLAAAVFLLAAVAFFVYVKAASSQAESDKDPATTGTVGNQGITWVRSNGHLIRPKVRGYKEGIRVEDSANVIVEDPEVRN